MPWQIAIAIFQVFYTIYTQRRARRAAKKQEKAARQAEEQARNAGQEVRITNSNQSIPFAYGYTIVPAINVYHKLDKSYIHTTENDGTVQVIGGQGIYSGATPYIPSTRSNFLRKGRRARPAFHGYNTQIDKSVIGTYREGSYTAKRLFPFVQRNTAKTIHKTEHSMLFIQSAICMAPIRNIESIDVDNIPYTNFKIWGWSKFHISLTGNIRVPFSEYYRDGEDGENAIGTGIVTGHALFEKNRDYPQFQGPPKTTYYLLGRLVRDINRFALTDRDGNFERYAYVLSHNRRWSNNAVLVAIDYSLEEAGLNLPIDQWDWEKMYIAKRIADRRVMNAEVTGRVFSTQTPHPKPDMIVRPLRKYEFNGNLDTANTGLDNLEEIINSMPGAEMVVTPDKWYINIPDEDKSTEDHIVATLTDDDIIKPIIIVQSNADERLNEATVTFANASKDFALDAFTYVNDTYRSIDSAGKDPGDVILKEEFDAAGITNMYHAKFMAEYLVHESRLSTYQFTTNLKGLSLQKGDVIRIVSEWQDINRIVRIASVKPIVDKQNSILNSVDIEAEDFDIENYRFRPPDQEKIVTKEEFDDTVELPTNVQVSIVDDRKVGYNILVTWEDADDNKISQYDIFIYLQDEPEFTGSEPQSLVGTAYPGQQSFEHILTENEDYYIKIRPKTYDGRYGINPVDTERSTIFSVPSFFFGADPVVDEDVMLNVAMQGTNVVPLGIPAPLPPTGLQITEPLDNLLLSDFRLTWSHPENHNLIVAYEIEKYDEVNQVWNNVKNVSADDTQITSIQSTDTGTYRMRSVDVGSYKSDYTEEITITLNERLVPDREIFSYDGRLVSEQGHRLPNLDYVDLFDGQITNGFDIVLHDENEVDGDGNVDHSLDETVIELLSTSGKDQLEYEFIWNVTEEQVLKSFFFDIEPVTRKHVGAVVPIADAFIDTSSTYNRSNGNVQLDLINNRVGGSTQMLSNDPANTRMRKDMAPIGSIVRYPSRPVKPGPESSAYMLRSRNPIVMPNMSVYTPTRSGLLRFKLTMTKTNNIQVAFKSLAFRCFAKTKSEFATITVQPTGTTYQFGRTFEQILSISANTLESNINIRYDQLTNNSVRLFSINESQPVRIQITGY